MTHEVSTITVNSPFETTIHNRFNYHTPPVDKLMILLPGRGYTVDNPALFHLLFLGLENGYDVLPVQYGFQVNQSELEPAQMPYLMQDVQIAVEQVLERNYREICVVGKSLGTPLALELAKILDADKVSLVLLTPIGPALQNLPDLPTLAVIGTGDPFYSAEMVQETDKHPNLQWVVLDDLNHGLLIETDWKTSVQSLYTILEHCEQFLKRE